MDSLIIPKSQILDSAFFPESVAVAGASDQPISFGYHFLKHLLDYKYAGKIYPINPKKESLLGLKCYHSLTAVPGDIEFVICCLPSAKVLPMLDECAAKNVKIVHLLTARLGETGRPAAVELEKQIMLRARQYGIRLIGPNCMGIYCPASGISFAYNLPLETGKIGVVSQSGGASTLLMQQASLQGLRFSKAVSFGNALDLDECDILEYFIDDDETDIIAAYFEGVRNGERFLNTLKRATAKKPVVAIKGGKGRSGARATASHTAAIAGAHNIWQTVFRQTGVVEVTNLEEMINLLQLFCSLPPIYSNKAAIMGGGGGKAVIAADLAEAAGLEVPPLTDAIRAKLKEMGSDLWDWMGNPVDTSIFSDFGLIFTELPKIFEESPGYDFIIIQSSEDNPMDDDLWIYLVKGGVDLTIDVFKRGKKPVIGVLSGGKPGSDGMQNIRWKTLAEQRSRMIKEGVPVFDTIIEAVTAMGQYVRYWQHRMR